MHKMVQQKLMTIEDVSLEYAVRANAARELGRMGDKKSAEDLIKILPKTDGTVFLEIVIALGEIENTSVLPKLLEIQHEPLSCRHGKTNCALHYTIERLTRIQEEQLLRRMERVAMRTLEVACRWAK